MFHGPISDRGGNGGGGTDLLVAVGIGVSAFVVLAIVGVVAFRYMLKKARVSLSANAYRKLDEDVTAMVLSSPPLHDVPLYEDVGVDWVGSNSQM